MKLFHAAIIITSFLFVSCITTNKGDDPTANEEQDYGFLEDRNSEGHWDQIPEKSGYINEGFGEQHQNVQQDAFGTSIVHGSRPALSQNGLKTHEFRDARTGLVVQRTAYPSSWTVISKPSYTVDQKLPVFMIQTSGPNDLKSFNTPFRINISYQNPQTYQFMQKATYASMHRPMVSNQQILKEEVQPRMEKSGFAYVKNIRLTTSENFMKNKIKKEGQGQVQAELLTTVWENDEGQKALVNIGKIYRQQPLSTIDIMTLWMYSVDYTFVDAGHFEKTVDAFENALVNTKEDLQWQQYVAQLSRQRQQQAIRDHQIHMRNKDAAFQAHQRKMQGIWAAQDANYASFMNKHLGPGSDRTHRNFVNMINEEETVYNPLDGTTYQVNAFSEQNWMDGNGNLVQNNDLFYTPNGDINLNNRDWVQVVPQN